MANATKRVLAAALKERLARQRLDEITIQSLVDDAQVSRKTFYYHFQDVYALLEWLFLEEGKRVLEGNVGASTWQIGMRRIFAYGQENKTVILNVYRCLEDREGLLEIHISRLVRPLLERIFDEMPYSGQVDQEDRKLILDFLRFRTGGALPAVDWERDEAGRRTADGPAGPYLQREYGEPHPAVSERGELRGRRTQQVVSLQFGRTDRSNGHRMGCGKAT